MDMHHIGEFTDSGMFAHQDTYLLNDISTMYTIGVTAENQTI